MKLNRSYFALFIAVIIFVGSLITWYTYKQAKEEAVNSLIARTDTIAQLVAEADLSSLSYTEADLSNPVYQKIKQHFENARKVNKDIRFIYIFVQDEGETKFVVDSEPDDSPDYSPPGQVYEEAEDQYEIAQVFSEGGSMLQEAYTDRWGTWITALSAIKDGAGTPKYIVGIDIDASDFIIKPYIVAAFPASLSLVLLVLAFALYFVRKKELELIKAKSQFISVASHELRSPLTGIRWSAENLLRQEGLTEAVRSTVKSVHASSLHLLSIINDLLNVSLSKQDFIDKKSFNVLDVKELVNTAISDLSVAADENELKIVCDTSAEKLLVKGDAERLQSLFSNIISNAIKYSRKRETISIAMGMHRHFSKKIVRVAVRDLGIGIPCEDLKKVMEGFYRAQNAKTYTANGTGLGLYMCKKIAELHGGDLYVDSIEGKGTLIMISLPFYEK